MKNIILIFKSFKNWLRIINHENCLFPEIKEQLGTLSTKGKINKNIRFCPNRKAFTI